MRKTFATELLHAARKNPDIYLITADLGYGVWDQFKKELPQQYLNTGASEQAACGIAVGLALAGKIPVLYSITPFLLYRPFETIRDYIHHERIPVLLVGSGRDADYEHDGFSHFAGDDQEMMTLFPNIHSYWPQRKQDIPELLKIILSSREPTYLNLAR